MKKYFTEEEIIKISSLEKELRREKNPELTLQENLESALSKRVTEIDAGKAVDDLCGGVGDFEEMYKNAEHKDMKEVILESIEGSALKEYDLQKQCTVLTDILNTVLEQASVDSESFAVKPQGQYTESDLEFLKEQVAEYLDEYSLIYTENEASLKLFEAVGDEASEALKDIVEDEEGAYYMALATYILHLQGELEDIPVHMGAREVGISVASVLTSIKVKLEGLVKNIPWDKIAVILKKTASVAMTLLVDGAIAVAAYAAVKLVVVLSSFIFGTGLIGIIIAGLCAFGCGKSIIKTLVNVREDIKSTASELAARAREYYERFTTWVKETAIPKIKAFIAAIKAKLSAAVNGLAQSLQEAEAADNAQNEENAEDENEDLEDEDEENDNGEETPENAFA